MIENPKYEPLDYPDQITPQHIIFDFIQDTQNAATLKKWSVAFTDALNKVSTKELRDANLMSEDKFSPHLSDGESTPKVKGFEQSFSGFEARQADAEAAVNSNETSDRPGYGSRSFDSTQSASEFQSNEYYQDYSNGIFVSNKIPGVSISTSDGLQEKASQLLDIIEDLYLHDPSFKTDIESLVKKEGKLTFNVEELATNILGIRVGNDIKISSETVTDTKVIADMVDPN